MALLALLGLILSCTCLRVTQNAYFSLLTHTKQLLFLTVCDATVEIGNLEVVFDADAADAAV